MINNISFDICVRLVKGDDLEGLFVLVEVVLLGMIIFLLDRVMFDNKLKCFIREE